ncbi:uncharacterized protein LOC143842726 [Paroedura picta]|uniref:uncharacterized protein LOC143842726 n=1 Tax=Paroedura picta TaxID=143630 RepID=UPI004055CFB0
MASAMEIGAFHYEKIPLCPDVGDARQGSNMCIESICELEERRISLALAASPTHSDEQMSQLRTMLLLCRPPTVELHPERLRIMPLPLWNEPSKKMVQNLQTEDEIPVRKSAMARATKNPIAHRRLTNDFHSLEPCVSDEDASCKNK